MNQEARIREMRTLDSIDLGALTKRLGLKRKDIAKSLGVTEGAVSLGFNDPGGKKQHRIEMRERIINFLVKYEQTGNVQKKSPAHRTSGRKLRAA